MADDWTTRIKAWKEANDIVYNVINCTKPIVSAIEEPAVGAGLAAAMVADDDKVIDTAMQVCRKLARGAPVAIRFTKYALNNWLRMAGPTFDASLALEFMGFSGPEVREGYSALMQKRKPDFDPDCPF